MQPLTETGPHDAEIGTQQSISLESAREACMSSLEVLNTMSVLSDGRNRSSRCAAVFLIDTWIPDGQASNMAKTSRTSFDHSLSRTGLSVKEALCLTLTGIDPKRSRTVTRVPWSKLTSLNSGGDGRCLARTLEL